MSVVIAIYQTLVKPDIERITAYLGAFGELEGRDFKGYTSIFRTATDTQPFKELVVMVHDETIHSEDMHVLFIHNDPRRLVDMEAVNTAQAEIMQFWSERVTVVNSIVQYTGSDWTAYAIKGDTKALFEEFTRSKREQMKVISNT